MQNVIITGAASGIGKHLAQTLLARGGYRLALADINQPALEELYQPSPSLQIFALDVRDSEQWQTMLNAVFTQWGNLDYVFNIAGVIIPGFIYQTPLKMLDYQLDINTKGLMYGTKLAAEYMTKQRSGHIINIASLAGVAPIAGMSAYSASKFAVRGFSLAIATELRPFDVYVSVVCPDLVDTPMLDMQLDYPEAAMAFSGSSKPLTTEDVVQGLLKVMNTKQLELTLPLQRGLLAKFGNSFPTFSQMLTRSLFRKGRQAQVRMKDERNH